MTEPPTLDSSGREYLSVKLDDPSFPAPVFASLVDTQEVQHFDPREFIAHGDKVIVLGHYAWRVKMTGREFGGDFAHVFTVDNGKVVRVHEYMDTAAAAAAHRRDRYDEAEAG